MGRCHVKFRPATLESSSRRQRASNRPPSDRTGAHKGRVGTDAHVDGLPLAFIVQHEVPRREMPIQFTQPSQVFS